MSSNSSYFKINPEVLCNIYSPDKACRDKICEFLTSQGRWQYLDALYKSYLSRQDPAERKLNEARLTHGSAWASKFRDSATSREMIRQMESDIDVTEDGSKMNWYYFPHFHREVVTFDGGVILNESIDLSYSVESHQPYFRYFFAVMLSKTDWPEQFLNYHFENSFSSEVEYRKFFALLDKDLLKNRIEFLNEWRENDLKKKPKKERTAEKTKTHELSDFFTSHHELENVLRDHLFKNNGTQLRPNKDLLLRQIAIALKESLKSSDKISGMISAELLAGLIYNCAFGTKLELRFQPLRKLLSPKKLKEIDASSALNKAVKMFS